LILFRKKRKLFFAKGVYNYGTVILQNSSLFSSDKFSKERKKETRVSDSTCIALHIHASGRSISFVVEIK